MTSSRVRATLAIAFVLAPLALLAAACSRPPEQQFLTQFFRAARVRDNESLAMMSAVPFRPSEEGAVEDFEITSVSEERRTPFSLKPLLDAEAKAKADSDAFTRTKIAYQNENLPIIEEVVKLERQPGAKFTPAQQKVKAEWDKWRADTTMHAKNLSAARAAIQAATGPAEASLTQPGQSAFDATKFQGDLLSKDVTVNAQVSKDGQTTPKTLVITMQKVTGTMDGQTREGRWVITKIAGA